MTDTTMTDTRAIYPSLRDRRVIVTGGGSGIGAGLVEAFVRQGAKVAFVDVAEAESQALVERLSAGATHVPLFRRLDLTDLDAVARVFADMQEALGGVDVLVNNAGNDDRHTVADVTPAYWDERMNVNLRHQFFAAKAVVPGNVKTPRQEKWYTPEGEAEIVAGQCLDGRILPEDVAALVLFLASDDAKMCTGHNYWVDAGWR